MNRFYKYDDTLAPWLGPNVDETVLGTLVSYKISGLALQSGEHLSSPIQQIGWMMEALVIDPFDSNHWLYGTGATIYGGHDLLKWDSARNVTLKSLADGIEETSVQSLISPPTGPPLISALGDIQGSRIYVYDFFHLCDFETGFVHNSLTTAPLTSFTNPTWSTAVDVDFAGNKPTNIVRLGNGDR